MQAPNPIPDLFADMGRHIGMSRPAGQCLGMIWRAAQAPCADDLTLSLGLSRSNVSTALKELREWGLISVARAPGDRKEYFTAPSEAWALIRAIIAARHRRAVVPLLDRLLAEETRSPDARIAALHSALEEVSAWMAELGTIAPHDLASRFQTEPAQPSPQKRAKKKKKGKGKSKALKT
jgi:DNA-binding transcriptional regulator GbsR (MarR family)